MRVMLLCDEAVGGDVSLDEVRVEMTMMKQ